MVGKLIKNEFIDSRKHFGPVVLMTLTITLILTFVVNSTFQGSASAFIIPILMLIIMGLSVAIVVLWIGGLIKLLYRSIYNQNAYRLFTMPVKTWEIIVSKLVVYFLWSFIIGVVSMISLVFFVVVTWGSFEIIEVAQNLIAYVLQTFTAPQLGIFLLSTLVDGLLTAFTLLFVGSIIHSSFVQNHRGILTFVGYLVITSIITRITVGFFSNMSFADISFNELILMNPDLLSNLNPLVDGWDQIFVLVSNPSGFKILAQITLLEALFCGLMFMGTIWFWENKMEIIE